MVVARFAPDQRSGQGGENRCQLGAGLEAPIGVLVQAFDDDGVEGRGDASIDDGWDRRRVLDDFAGHLVHGLAGERPLSGEQGVEHDAEGEEIGTPVDGPGGDLLRRHEVRGADELAVHRQARAFHAGDPEVGDAGAAVGGQDQVARFDVAVDDSHPVGVVEGDGDIGDDAGRFGRPEAVSGGQDLLEVPSFDVLHRDEEHPGRAVLTDIVDGDDAGVVEAACGLRLPEESFAELVGDLGVDIEPQGLERHHAVDERVAGEIDDAHGAPAERLDDLVATDVGDGHPVHSTVVGRQRKITVPNSYPASAATA